MSDHDLESAARYYLWLAEAFPDSRSLRLAEITEEANHRGKPEIVKQAAASIHNERDTRPQRMTAPPRRLSPSDG